jgi:hypothetical protein
MAQPQRVPTVRELVTAATAQGWRVDLTGKHIQLFPPTGGKPIWLPHDQKKRINDQAKAARRSGLAI